MIQDRPSIRRERELGRISECQFTRNPIYDTFEHEDPSGCRMTTTSLFANSAVRNFTPCQQPAMFLHNALRIVLSTLNFEGPHVKMIQEIRAFIRCLEEIRTNGLNTVGLALFSLRKYGGIIFGKESLFLRLSGTKRYRLLKISRS